MAPRSVHLLGTPCITPDGAGGLARGRKPWAIVAYLALEVRPVTRDELISLLFADAADPGAALRWNLGQARRVLGEADSLRGQLLTLPATVTVDVTSVVRGRWPGAVALPGLGHELLEGMQFPGCSMFEMWLVGARRRLAAATEAILHEAAVASLAAGKAEDAAGFAAQLVALAPLVDAHHELLIRAYVMAGDENAARRHLEAAVRLFRAEIGSDPAPPVFLAAEATRRRARLEPSAARTRALLAAGRTQAAAGSLETALRVLNEACNEASATGDVHLQAAAQFELGAALAGAGSARHQEAELALFSAIELATQTGDQRIAAAAYRHLAASELFRGAYGRVIAWLDEAERLHDGSDDERVELSAIRGAALLDLGERFRALEEMRRGIDADPGESHYFLPLLLTHTGRAYMLGGELTLARKRLERSRQLIAERAWAGLSAAPLSLLGHIAVLEDNLGQAADLLETAFESACQADDPCWETWSAHGLARLASARGETTTALTRYADTIYRSSPQRGGHLWSRVWALVDAAATARIAGDERAGAWYREALETAQRTGMSDHLTALSSTRPSSN